MPFNPISAVFDSGNTNFLTEDAPSWPEYTHRDPVAASYTSSSFDRKFHADETEKEPTKNEEKPSSETPKTKGCFLTRFENVDNAWPLLNRR